MNEQDFNERLVRACRAAATERPTVALDDNVLRAAHAHVSQRRRRRLIPLAAAAALGAVVVSSHRLRDASDVVRSTTAANSVTAELLRMQPPIATSSAVTDYLLNANSWPTSGDDTDEGTAPTEGCPQCRTHE